MIDVKELVPNLKELLEDEYADTTLEFYLRKSVRSILNYSNMSTDELKNNFLDVVVELSMFYLDNKDNMNIKSENTNKSNITYNDNEDMPKSIKSQLPCYCSFF